MALKAREACALSAKTLEIGVAGGGGVGTGSHSDQLNVRRWVNGSSTVPCGGS